MGGECAITGQASGLAGDVPVKTTTPTGDRITARVYTLNAPRSEVRRQEPLIGNGCNARLKKDAVTTLTSAHPHTRCQAGSCHAVKVLIHPIMAIKRWLNLVNWASRGAGFSLLRRPRSTRKRREGVFKKTLRSAPSAHRAGGKRSARARTHTRCVKRPRSRSLPPFFLPNSREEGRGSSASPTRRASEHQHQRASSLMRLAHRPGPNL